MRNHEPAGAAAAQSPPAISRTPLLVLVEAALALSLPLALWLLPQAASIAMVVTASSGTSVRERARVVMAVLLPGRRNGCRSGPRRRLARPGGRRRPGPAAADRGRRRTT